MLNFILNEHYIYMYICIGMMASPGMGPGAAVSSAAMMAAAAGRWRKREGGRERGREGGASVLLCLLYSNIVIPFFLVCWDRQHCCDSGRSRAGTRRGLRHYSAKISRGTEEVRSHAAAKEGGKGGGEGGRDK